MKKIVSSIVFMSLLSITGGRISAEDMIVYPAQGQSQQQMEKDKFECYSWAKQQVGFDPIKDQTVQTPTTPNSGPSGERVKGAARGAALGAVVGEIADDDAGKGAAAGAAAGVMAGGMKNRRQRRQQTQQQQAEAQKQQTMHEQAQDAYGRAFSACLESKGYTVK